MPEAQQDRFMFSIQVDYPDLETELQIVRQTTAAESVTINPVINDSQIKEYRELVSWVPVAESVITAAVKLVRATRPRP